MNKRNFLKTLLGLSAVIPALGRNAAAATVPPVIGGRRIHLQTSPLAGFQYHAGEALWPQLQTGDALQLQREPRNPHDRWAVKVLWRGRKLGYIPRVENTAIAHLLDSGEILSASLERLQRSRNPWQRVQIRIELESGGGPTLPAMARRIIEVS